jgi:hypothetical protein
MSLNSKFVTGDRVYKINYPNTNSSGTVVSVFENLSGSVRVAIELDGYGLIYVFREDELEKQEHGERIN